MPDQTQTELKTRIAIRLAHLGLSANQLCNKPETGFSVRSLHSWMMSDTNKIKVGSIKRIAKALDLGDFTLLIQERRDAEALTV